MCIYIYTYVKLSSWAVRMYACMYACMHEMNSVYTCLYTYIHRYMYTYVHMCIYIYVYICIGPYVEALGSFDFDLADKLPRPLWADGHLCHDPGRLQARHNFGPKGDFGKVPGSL